MLELLRSIIERDHDSKKLRRIKSNPELVKWIEDNCNSILLSKDFPPEKLFEKKIYSIIFPDTVFICPFTGSYLKYITFTLPLRCRPNCECLLEKKRNETTSTCLERYGVVNPSQAKRFKEKRVKTVLNKYGVTSMFLSDEFKEKSKKTCLERYGCSYIGQSQYVKEKVKKTCLEKYGYESPMSNKEIREKCKNTILSRYGRKSISQVFYTDEAYTIVQSPELLKEHIIKYGFKDGARLLGTSYGTLYRYNRTYNLGLTGLTNSSQEEEINGWLQSLGIEFQRHDKSILGKREIDFYIPSKNLAIEFDGLYWHSVKYTKDANYHFDKMKGCLEKGINLLHIFEDEWEKQKDTSKSLILWNLDMKDMKLEDIPFFKIQEDCIIGDNRWHPASKISQYGYKVKSCGLPEMEYTNYHVRSHDSIYKHVIWNCGHNVYTKMPNTVL